MSPVSRSAAVGARVRRRTKNLNSAVDSDYVDPWDLENELYVKKLSVVEPPPLVQEPRKAGSRRTSNCYYGIGGFEEEDFQNERLYSYEKEADYWMQYGDYYYFEDELDPTFDAGLDHYHCYKPTACLDGHTYEECERRQTIYSDDYYIPMSSVNYYPSISPVGYQLYSPTRRSLASNPGSQQLRRVYETRKSRMALPTEDAALYERDWRLKDSADPQRMSVLSGYYSDEIPGDLTDDSLAPYSELRGPPPIPASHFGLTKHGHLKIDYSCNWSSLDRFIGHQNNYSFKNPSTRVC